MREDGVAVVCPTFNCSKYIDRTLSAIETQESYPDEVIFVDDGSEDDTISIIEKRRFRFEEAGMVLNILRTAREGPGAARNQGVVAATQPWIAFLDADDTWTREKLYRIREVMQENPHSNCFVHWEEYRRTNGDITTLKHGQIYDRARLLPQQLYHTNFLSTSAVVCKKALIQAVGGFDPSLPNSQDYELWLRMSPEMRLYVLPEVLGSYVENLCSISARPYYKRVYSQIRIAWRHREKGDSVLFLSKLVRIIFSKQWLLTLRNC